jgi:hypothetical protein
VKIERVNKMQDRWKLGNYTFTINPNKYTEQVSVVGDIITTLNGTVISQPTMLKEEYSLSSIFYQNRPKVIQQVSMPNLGGIKYVNGKYYVLNNTTKKVDVYTANYTLSKSISLLSTTPNGENFIAFDVQSDETVWAVQRSTPDIVYKVVGATITKTNFNSSYGSIKGIKYDSSALDLWIITDKNVLSLFTYPAWSQVKYLNLPIIAPNLLGYNGMDIINGYLVVSFVSDDISGAYHIDLTSGSICNVFSLPDLMQINDITYDGTNFVFSTQTGNQLVYTNGNTLSLDVYNLENEIRTKGYLDMIDDMGVKRRMTVNHYNIERQEGSLTKYSVDIQAVKVDRGNN